MSTWIISNLLFNKSIFYFVEMVNLFSFELRKCLEIENIKSYIIVTLEFSLGSLHNPKYFLWSPSFSMLVKSSNKKPKDIWKYKLVDIAEFEVTSFKYT